DGGSSSIHTGNPYCQECASTGMRRKAILQNAKTTNATSGKQTEVPMETPCVKYHIQNRTPIKAYAIEFALHALAYRAEQASFEGCSLCYGNDQHTGYVPRSTYDSSALAVAIAQA